MLDIGVSVLPKLPRDAGDRNRTSPFAFTGNKFEFRAVSSNQSIAFPATCLNVAVAESLDYMSGQLEAALAKGQGLEDAVAALLKKTIKQHKRIIFNGNGYSAEWQKEAGKRGLLNLKNTVDALPEIITPAVVKTFEKFKVLTERELHARYEVNLETYSKTINVEAQLMVLMANRYILPAALEYQRRVAESVAAVKAAGAASREGQEDARPAWSSWSTSSARRPMALAQGARPHERVDGREAREVHARHGRAGDGDAARPRRPDRADDAARAVAAADVSRDAVHQVGTTRDGCDTAGATGAAGAIGATRHDGCGRCDGCDRCDGCGAVGGSRAP